MASRNTPARGLRARNASQTPLPALPSRQSTAYGAVGKATLNTQLATSATGFEQAFDNAAAPRESEQPEQTPARKSRRKPKPPSPPIQDDEESAELAEESHDAEPESRTTFATINEEDDDDRPSTGIPEEAVYGFAAERPPGLRHDNLPTASTSIDSISQNLPRLLRDTGLKYRLKDVLLVALVLFQLITALVLGSLGTLTFAAMVPLPDESTISNLRDTLIAPFVPAAMQKIHNVLFVKSIARAQDEIKDLQGHMDIFKVELEKLNDLLPPALVVRRVGGEIVIADDMWDAIVSRLSHDNGAVWQRFVKENEERVAGLLEERFAGLAQQQQLVSRQELVEELKSHAQASQDRVAAILDQFKDTTLQQARADARDAAAYTIKSLTKDNTILKDASSLVRSVQAANVVLNLDRLMNSRNYFSIGLGARIEPQLTSPTQLPPTDTASRWLWSFISPPVAHPPSIALRPWTEATDCWCAKTTKGMGVAQIGVRLASRITPHRLVIEHIPADGTRDIAAAPRAFEVWADVGGAREAARFNNMDLESHDQGNRGEYCGQAPGSSFVCLGGGEYDIHHKNYLQEWYPSFNPQQYNLTTDRVVVRVKTNWGAAHTCIYRLWLGDT